MVSRFALFAFGIIGASAWSVAASAHSPAGDSFGDRTHDTRHHDDRDDCGPAPYHYRFVSLGNVEGDGYFFDFAALDNDRKVYGNAIACDDQTFVCQSFATVRDRRGHLSIQTDRQRNITAANENGVRAGSVPSPDGATAQAALFGRSRVELIPLEPGQVGSFVEGLSDSGIAIVSGYDETFTVTSHALYQRGRLTPLDVPDYRHIFVNDRGTVAGTAINDNPDDPDSVNTAFRLRSRTPVLETLSPVVPDPNSWAQGIDARGNVLGYSFVFDGLERIGVWKRDGSFETYLEQGTPELPTISNRLLWSESGLIVITQSDADYLVPERGVRLKVDDLVDEDSPYRTFGATFIVDVNERGDLLGLADTVDDNGAFVQTWFLLLRDDARR
jgi:hypothetical protein